MQQLNILSWDEYKTLISTKKLLIQYADSGDTYVLYAPENGELLWHISIAKDDGPDQRDFEENYKAFSNQPLETKASIGSPIRVVPTAQPLNTTEKWKGYHMEIAENELEKMLIINFPIEVFLRGGSVFSADCECDDYITVDVVWTEYPAMIIYPNLLETIYMMKGVPLPFISAECMKFPPMLSLQITYHKKDDGKTRCAIAVANFFEPPQM
jgi:hypothetical protein